MVPGFPGAAGRPPCAASAGLVLCAPATHDVAHRQHAHHLAAATAALADVQVPEPAAQHDGGSLVERPVGVGDDGNSGSGAPPRARCRDRHRGRATDSRMSRSVRMPGPWPSPSRTTAAPTLRWCICRAACLGVSPARRSERRRSSRLVPAWLLLLADLRSPQGTGVALGNSTRKDQSRTYSFQVLYRSSSPRVAAW